MFFGSMNCGSHFSVGLSFRPHLLTGVDNPRVCISLACAPPSTDLLVASFRPKVGVSDDANTSQLSSLPVGTPGLGYPLLLCQGKGLVVILDYVQTAGPLRSGVLFPRQRSRTCLTAGKGPGTPRVPEEAGAQPEQPGLRTSRGVRTPV